MFDELGVRMFWLCTIILEGNVHFDPKIGNMLNIHLHTTVLSYYYLMIHFQGKKKTPKKVGLPFLIK